jgi:acetate kinase
MSFTLTLNLGSSSLKYKLFYKETLKVRSEGIIEEIGKESTCSFKHYENNKVKKDKHKCNARDHKEAIHQVLELLTSKSNILSDKTDVSMVCHRVVHGGDKLYKPKLIDEEVY